MLFPFVSKFNSNFLYFAFFGVWASLKETSFYAKLSIRCTVLNLVNIFRQFYSTSPLFYPALRHFFEHIKHALNWSQFFLFIDKLLRFCFEASGTVPNVYFKDP